MKVIFIPYDRNNPYQDLLKESLEKEGGTIYYESFSLPFSILKQALKHWKPDVIHLHWLYPFFVRLRMKPNRFIHMLRLVYFVFELFSILILKIYGIRIIWTAHNIFSHEEKFVSAEKFLRKILARLCDKIVVHSRFAKEEVERVYGLTEGSRIVIIPHGNYINCYSNVVSKDEARERLGMDKNDWIFLFFGQVKPYKGIFELIEAFGKLKASKAKLVIAGRPANKMILENVTKKCEGNENIRLFLEYISLDKVQLFMNAANVVVVPYREILTSGAILLAMSFGKPVIAPRVGPIPEILDEEGGIQYDPWDGEGLYNALKNALNIDVVATGKHNYKVAEEFDWGHIAKKTLKAYEKN